MILRPALLLFSPIFFSPAQPLEISRPARPWESMDAVGPKAAVFGFESGTVEAWVFPFKVVKDLRLRFRSDGRTIPADRISRRVVSRPGSYTVVYAGDDFRVEETFCVPVDEPGILIRLEVETRGPLQIEATFAGDFQPMWPAALGSSYVDWSKDLPGYWFGADGYPYFAILGSPGATMVEREHAADSSRAPETTFSLGTVTGRATRSIVIAGSVKSRDEARAVYKRVLAASPATIEEYYAAYLAKTLRLDLPDERLRSAYDWSRLSVFKGLVSNPFLGEGLAAGFGPSRGAYRPGFGWFFGRDTFWSSMALTAAGDFESARRALRFIARFQREDGKIPHEISQSATLVNWFRNFSYGFASADATPLFLIAMRDYTAGSADLELATELWPKLEKALAFMTSTADEAGFPKNAGVGHGWVEGGPLLPVRTEFYQAGVAVEALRSMAELARRLKKPELAARLEEQFAAQKQKLHDLFWLESEGIYAFAIAPNGKPVNEPTALAAVPMRFGLTEPEPSRRMIAKLAAEEYSTDWGMRLVSRRSRIYSPAGYHFGSVWPLYTGWTALGAYRYHAAQAGWAALQANAALALDGAGGNTAEALSGDVYAPLSTSTPHQVWSAAMVVSPLVRGLLGLDFAWADNRIEFAPHLPADWNRVGLRSDVLTATLERADRRLTLEFTTPAAQVRFAPAFPPCVEVTGAQFNGSKIRWTAEDGGWDWHPVFDLEPASGVNRLVIRYRGFFGYQPRLNPPELARPSANLKVLSETWSKLGVDIRVSGLAGRSYVIDLVGDRRAASVKGAAIAASGHSMEVQVPGKEPEGYREQVIEVRWR